MEKVNKIKIIKNLEKEILQEVLNDSSGYFTFDEEIYPTSVVLRAIIDLVLLDVLQRNNQKHQHKMFKKLKDSLLPENLYNALEETIIDEFHGQTSEVEHEIVHFSIMINDKDILKIIQDFMLQFKIEDEIIETFVVDEFQKMNSYKDIKNSNVDSFSAYADMEEEEWSQTFKEGSIVFVEIQSFTNTIKNEVAGNFLNEEFGNSCTLMFNNLTLSNKDLFVKQIYQDMLTYGFYLSNGSINELFDKIQKKTNF